MISKDHSVNMKKLLLVMISQIGGLRRVGGNWWKISLPRVQACLF